MRFMPKEMIEAPCAPKYGSHSVILQGALHAMRALSRRHAPQELCCLKVVRLNRKTTFDHVQINSQN